MTIATMRANLTEDDIRRLVRGGVPEDRAGAAQKICRRIDDLVLAPEDRTHAAQILDLLANDAAVLVRRTLAVTLRNSPNLPREIALRLARDVDAVATPVLKNSPAFTDEDLIEILRTSDAAKQVAIAGRPQVSEAVVDAIVETGLEEAVEAAALNEGAAFSERAFERTLDRFPESRRVQSAVVSRPVLPLHITEKLVNMVSGELFDRLVSRHELPPQLAIELANASRERATIDLIDQAVLSSDTGRFVQQLHLNGRLTPSLVMRGLCLGHMEFVEWAIAELAGVPRQKAWLMIHDAGVLGLKTVFERAGLPNGMFTAFRLALQVYHNTQFDGGPGDRERFRQRMVERVLTQFQAIPKADLDYLLEKLNAVEGREMEPAEAIAPAA